MIEQEKMNRDNQKEDAKKYKTERVRRIRSILLKSIVGEIIY